MAHEIGNQVIDEIEAVFERHNIVGVVSFVRLVNVEPIQGGQTFDLEGGAGVFMSAEADDACIFAALDYVENQQDDLSSSLKECKSEIKQRVKLARTAN